MHFVEKNMDIIVIFLLTFELKRDIITEKG